MVQSHAHRSVERARNRKGARNRDLAETARRIVRSWASGEGAETLMARLAVHIARIPLSEDDDEPRGRMN